MKMYLIFSFVFFLLIHPLRISAQHTVLLKETRNLVIQDKIDQAISGYANLVEKEPANTKLLSEYAYALALGGVFDGALMNLDKVRTFSVMSSDDYFYTSQVFSLMGYNRLANEFLKNTINIPLWISSDYISLAQKHQQITNINHDDYPIAFKRANYLAVNGLCFQSMAVYLEIISEYPLEYLPHTGYSIVLEKVGLYKKAANEMEIGLSLMPDDGPQYDAAKQTFSQRLAQLKQKETAAPQTQNGFLKRFNKYNPKTMLYAGGMFSSDYISFDSRFGVYFSNSFNGAVNFGVSGNSGAVAANLGISGYQRLGNVFMIGLGINERLGKDNTLFSINPSLGLSFINEKRTASWDLFFNIYCPVQEGASNMYGISIGKSFYFGQRK
jgi:tetratricopeptide (TPR) repeat protein